MTDPRTGTIMDMIGAIEGTGEEGIVGGVEEGTGAEEAEEVEVIAGDRSTNYEYTTAALHCNQEMVSAEM